jgi:hypothetical protein
MQRLYNLKRAGSFLTRPTARPVLPAVRFPRQISAFANMESGDSSAAQSAAKDAVQKGEIKDATPAPLPKLSAKEFRIYNGKAEHMDLFVCFCDILSLIILQLC